MFSLTYFMLPGVLGILVLFILVQQFELIRSEIFTAQVELEALFTLQDSVVSAVETYLIYEEIRLEEIRVRLKNFLEREPNQQSSQRHQSQEDIILNPINAFLIVKGLSVDLDNILSLSDNTRIYDDLIERINELKRRQTFPTKEDLTGAATALRRLQDTYLLDTASMSVGLLNDHCCASQLSADDCFELGRQSYYSKDYGHTIQWMNQALQKIQEERENSSLVNPEPRSRLFQSVTQSEILEYKTWAEEIQESFNMAKDLLAKTTGIEFDAFMTKIAQNLESQVTYQEKLRMQTFAAVKPTYESLCRGENRAAASENSKLKCSYTNNGAPFLLISPVKKEIVHLDPEVVIYHDILYDSEIEVIKILATPEFDSATVVNSITGESERSAVRVSKSAWLVESDHFSIAKINQRVGFITGLDMETSEDLQISNYGLGGHYEPHYDFSYGHSVPNSGLEETRDRVATLLFYMSDVQAGGATVFPSMNLSIWPEKGSAVFWYNLLDDGEGDFRTKHAACPVLIGSKWVSNKWMHERGQEFRRPCKPKVGNPFVEPEDNILH